MVEKALEEANARMATVEVRLGVLAVEKVQRFRHYPKRKSVMPMQSFPWSKRKNGGLVSRIGLLQP